MRGPPPRPGVPQPLKHRGGTLKVGEQEPDRLRGHQPRASRRGDAHRTGWKSTGLLNRAARTSYVCCSSGRPVRPASRARGWLATCPPRIRAAPGGPVSSRASGRSC